MIQFKNNDYGSSASLVNKSGSSFTSFLSLQTSEGGTFISPTEISCKYLYDNPDESYTPNLRIDSQGYIRRTTGTSSKRYKNDIQELKDNELNPQKLYDLKVKQFKYKTDFLNNKTDSRYNKNLIGFIAEDVAEIYPIAVDYEKDENGNKIIDNWNERYIIPAMLKLIQEQHLSIQELSTKVEELESKIKEMEENNG